MKIRINGTYGLREVYIPILNKYEFEVDEAEEGYPPTYYVNINTLEQLLKLAEEIGGCDDSELIIDGYVLGGNEPSIEIYKKERRISESFV